MMVKNKEKLFQSDSRLIFLSIACSFYFDIAKIPFFERIGLYDSYSE